MMVQRCTLCRKNVSSVSLDVCSECGEKICRDCLYSCVVCEVILCKSCGYFCESCGEPVCHDCALVAGNEERPDVLCEECHEEMEGYYMLHSNLEKPLRALSQDHYA